MTERAARHQWWCGGKEPCACTDGWRQQEAERTGSMTERAQALEAAEPWREQLDRLRQMASPDGDWDLSDNDRAAIQAAIDRAVQPPPPVGSPTTEHEHDYVTVELCRHCLRTEADITGECHHCGEGTGARCWWCLKLKSASAQASDPPKTWIPTEGCSCYLCRAARFSPTPVSPVEPTPEPPTEDWYIGGRIDKCPDPRCGCSMEHSPDCAMPAPTGAPAPCVWREETWGDVQPMFTVPCMNRGAVRQPMSTNWKFCPYCGHPLTVER